MSCPVAVRLLSLSKSGILYYAVFLLFVSFKNNEGSEFCISLFSVPFGFSVVDFKGIYVGFRMEALSPRESATLSEVSFKWVRPSAFG